MLGESSMMIGDCKTRMENAFNDLLAAVVRDEASPRTRALRVGPILARVPTRGGPRSDTHRPFPSPGRTRRGGVTAARIAAANAIFLDEVEPLIEDN